MLKLGLRCQRTCGTRFTQHVENGYFLFLNLHLCFIYYIDHTMNTHVHFNDDGEVIQGPLQHDDAMQTPTQPHRPSSMIISPDYTDQLNFTPSSDDDDDEAYQELQRHEGSDSDDSECSDDFDCSDDDRLVTPLRTHCRAPNRFRQTVDMSHFCSLHAHLASINHLESNAITTLAGRVAEYIGWVMDAEHVDQPAAVDIILTKPLTAIKYFGVLKGDYGLKPLTIYNTCLDFTRWAKYLAIYEDSFITPLLIVLQDHQKLENRHGRRQQSDRYSIEHLRANQQWPAGGKKELSRLLLKQKSVVDRIIQKAINGALIPDQDLIFVNDWVVSHVFVENPQGRSNAITTMPVTDIDALGGGQATSTQFKTRRTFGSQSINCNPVTYEYMKAYVAHIRPHLLLRSRTSTELFLNVNGVKHKDVGLCVTRFFRSVSSYHITVTTLRSLFETEARDAVDCGRLTQEECADVIRNSGHSTATSNQHYLKRQAEAAGRNAMATHTKLYGTDCNKAAPPQPRYDCDGDYEAPPPADASKQHPTKRRRVRAAWTLNEMHHLLTWVAKYETGNAVGAPKDWNACLVAMRTQAGVFAPHHLTTNGLRDAWRREVKKSV